MFPSDALVRRIERAECDLLRACTEVADGHSGGTHLMDVGGGLASYAFPDAPMNKVSGLGFAALSPEELDTIEAMYQSVGCPVQIELSTHADPSIAPLLTGRGYALVGFENVYAQALPASVEEPSSSIEIVSTTDEGTWSDVLVRAFLQTDGQGVASHESFPEDSMRHAMRVMGSVPRFRKYLALIDGEVVGAGSLRITDGIAHLCGAATLPAFRRRGVQTALLTARLADAHREGCDLAVMVTMPGSKSHENACRRGFQLLYPRAMLLRGWSGVE